MKLCKLTTQNLTTHNGFRWELGAWREAEGCGFEPCSPDVLHYYHHPILAVLLNPIHANIYNPRLFEIEIDNELDNDGLKGWCKRQRLVRELELPNITAEKKVEFAIRVNMLTCRNLAWQNWAKNWIQGVDRTVDSVMRLKARAFLPTGPYYATFTAAHYSSIPISVEAAFAIKRAGNNISKMVLLSLVKDLFKEV